MGSHHRDEIIRAALELGSESGFWLVVVCVLGTLATYALLGDRASRPIGPLNLEVRGDIWARIGDMWICSDFRIINRDNRRIVLNVLGYVNAGEQWECFPIHFKCLQGKGPLGGSVSYDALIGQSPHISGDINLESGGVISGHIEWRLDDSNRELLRMLPPTIVLRDVLTNREHVPPIPYALLSGMTLDVSAHKVEPPNELSPSR